MKHKAKVLTKKEVEKGRSNFYRYFDFKDSKSVNFKTKLN